MCLAFLAWNVHPDYAAVLLFNRDAVYSRPSHGPGWWPAPGVFGPRDPVRGGTWIGVSSRTGNFAFLTTVAEENGGVPRPISRGAVVSDFLQRAVTPARYVQQLRGTDGATGGYNVVVGNLHSGSLLAHSNRGAPGAVPLGDGLHSLSNGRLSDSWPKAQRGLVQLQRMLCSPTPKTDEQGLSRDLFQVMSDTTRCPPEQAPVTGAGAAEDLLMSAICVDGISSEGKRYCTRSQTLLLMSHSGEVTWHERTRGASVAEGVNWITSHYAFRMNKQPSSADGDDSDGITANNVPGHASESGDRQRMQPVLRAKL